MPRYITPYPSHLTLHHSLFDSTQVAQLNLAIKNLMQLTNLQRDPRVYLMPDGVLLRLD